ncbi:MAG: biotin/lipoyl-containing protein [Candidatus Bathyarchaeia archaeon]
MHRLRKYNIIIDGKPYKVELITHVKGSPFSAKVNEEPYEAEFVGEFEPAAPFSIRVRGKVYEVELKRIDRDRPFPVKVNDIAFKVELKPAARRFVSKTPESPALISVVKPSRRAVVEGAVTAPMAGKIVSVLVKDGDSVKVGDVLCILEAMKMENEITATKAGIVHEVKVSEGMPVNEGEALVIIK